MLNNYFIDYKYPRLLTEIETQQINYSTAALLPNNFRRNEVDPYKITRNLKQLTKTNQRKTGDPIPHR